MSFVQFQFQSDFEPSLSEVAERYGVPVERFDLNYGVYVTDESQGLYETRIEAAAAEIVEERMRERGEDGNPAVGVFRGPKIEPSVDEGEPEN